MLIFSLYLFISNVERMLTRNAALWFLPVLCFVVDLAIKGANAFDRENELNSNAVGVNMVTPRRNFVNHPHHDKYPSNDYELAVKLAKELECLLTEHFYATGKGLNEKAWSAQAQFNFPLHLTDTIFSLGHMRNRLVHEKGFERIPNRREFIEWFERSEAELETQRQLLREKLQPHFSHRGSIDNSNGATMQKMAGSQVAEGFENLRAISTPPSMDSLKALPFQLVRQETTNSNLYICTYKSLDRLIHQRPQRDHSIGDVVPVYRFQKRSENINWEKQVWIITVSNLWKCRPTVLFNGKDLRGVRQSHHQTTLQVESVKSVGVNQWRIDFMVMHNKGSKPKPVQANEKSFIEFSFEDNVCLKAYEHVQIDRFQQKPCTQATDKVLMD